MKRELQKRLITTYPNLFIHEEGYVGAYGDIRFSGFQCHDGWYLLIDELMRVIDFHVRFNSKPKVQIKEVKEKFGILSFDFRGGDEFVHGMVMFAMHISGKICEYCGTNQNVGKTQGWISVCCKDCHDKIDNRKDLKWVPNENPRLMKLIKIKKILDEKK
jgi:hypothetical protein